MKWTVIAIIVSILVFASLGFVFFSIQSTLNKEHFSEHTAEPANAGKNEIAEKSISPERIERIIKSYDRISELPRKTSFMISFLDGNGNPRPERFLLTGRAEVIKYDGRPVDGEIIIPDYWIPEFEKADDICNVAKKIRKSDDYVIKKQAGLPKLLFKYGHLIPLIRECAE